VTSERAKGKAAANARALRITDQFRKNRGIVYDFRCEGDRLTVCITPRSNEDDEGDWRAEAWSGPANVNVVREWGISPAEAVRAVGDSWTLHHAEHSLPAFDWAGVEKALGAVRAI